MKTLTTKNGTRQCTPEGLQQGCLKARMSLTQFAYNKKVHDRINQTNPALAMESKNTMGMIKIPDCVKFIVRCGGQYHMLVCSQVSIDSRDSYKKATGDNYPRRATHYIFVGVTQIRSLDI